MDKQYSVLWQIDVDAADAIEAARKALDMQRDRNSIATCFLVMEAGKRGAVEIDLLREQQQH